MVKIGDVEGVRGKLEKGGLKVGSFSDGSPIAIPILIATGEQDGPTLWLQGGVHGEEYGGAASIIKVVNSLDLKLLKGTVIAAPVVNIPSYLAKARTSPLDGENLNRIFPGNPKSTYSHQLAHTLVETIAATADYFIDLHSGGIGAEVPFYAIYVDDKSEAAQESKKLCKAIGVEYIWKIKGEAGLLGAIVAQIVHRGIPSVTVEVGGGNVTHQHIEEFSSSITNMMKSMGMLDGDYPILEKYTIITDGHFLFNREGGLFVPTCKVGDVLNEGDSIGYIKNLYGDTVEDILNPVDNAYIAAIRHQYWPCDAGDLIAESIVVECQESY